MIHVRIGDKPLDFIVDDDPDLPKELTGDVTRIKQIFINLLTNAVKFTREGHIILAVSAEPCETEGECRLKISVTDTGIGIRNEDIPQLFGNFSQVDTRKNRGIEGTGLGLAITQKLVELMGGEIRVESKYGEGSCFSLYVVQKIETVQPISKLPADEQRQVAIWQRPEVKSRILADKIRKLGASCDIIRGSESLAEYTHVFFDYSDFAKILKTPCGGAKLFAVARDLMDNEKMPPNMTAIHMPLTTLTVLRLLGGKTDGLDDSGADAEAYTIQLRDTRCLVVDDIDINLIIAEESLLVYGGAVDTASTGAQAIEMVKKYDYDIVFMDHMMPEMDGVDATKIIRALPGDKYQKLPIIALTANVVGDVRDTFMKSGMSDFLSKPLEHKEIERMLREWIPQEKWSSVPRDGAGKAEGSDV
jgi:CheY-like chemotaxis protein/anti-sigma regulatory factor (Ser/Thr protein kinase)